MNASQETSTINEQSYLPDFVGDHRHTCYWESIYDTSVNLSQFKKILIGEINTIRNNGDHLKKYVFILDTPEIELSTKPNTGRIKIEGATFEICDFRGSNIDQRITFKNCKFISVYFGHSVFSNVNFEDCSFTECSFSLTKFVDCIFDESCKFKKISISGGKTIFENSIICAENLLFNAYNYATTEYCKIYKLHKEEQVYKMYLSQVKLARNLLNSVSIIGDDDIYYQATKTLFKLRLKERESKINLRASNYYKHSKEEKRIKNLLLFSYKKSRALLFPVEKIMLNSFGIINGWGSNFLRCIFFGFAIVMIFSCIYYFQQHYYMNDAGIWTHQLYKSIIKSLDITFLAGYTKYSTTSDSVGQQWLLLSNMILGLFWYGVSLPTLINKISVARL